MHFNRLFRNKKLVGYIAIPVSTRDLLQNLDLAYGKGLVAVVLSQVSSDLGRNPLFASMYLADRFHEFLRWHAFEQVCAGASFESTLNLRVTCKRRENNDSSLRKLRAYGHHRIDAAHIGKAQVHQRDVRCMLPKALDGLPPSGGLGRQHHVRLISNDGGKPLMQQRMIINAENSN